MTDSMRTMLTGMVILMVPAFVICSVITVLALRRHKKDPS
jgi:hypothetical protein